MVPKISSKVWKVPKLGLWENHAFLWGQSKCMQVNGAMHFLWRIDRALTKHWLSHKEWQQFPIPNRPKIFLYSKIIELHMVGKLKLHRLLICKNLSGAQNGSRENRVLNVPLAVLCKLLLMPSSGVKPLRCWQTAYFGQLWTRFSLEPFWAPLRFLHIIN